MRIRRHAAILGGCVAVAVAMLAGADAAPPRTGAQRTVAVVRPAAQPTATSVFLPPRPFSQCTDTPGRSVATGLPPVPCYAGFQAGGPTFIQDYGLKLLPTTIYLGQSKLAMTLPASGARTYTAICATTYPPSVTCPARLSYPREDQSVTSGYYGVAAQIYIRSPAGVSPAYGVFPTATVHGLAFGSVPFSATVQVRQTATRGVTDPILLTWLSSGTRVTPGARVPGYEGYGPAPDSEQTFWEPPPKLAGPLAIRVSDVRLDGRPLDVGSRCESRATLSLTAHGGFYASTGQPNVEGTPGEYGPLGGGNSYLHGTVTIGAFRGCGYGRPAGTNLDALVSSLAAGGDNLVNVEQDGPLEPICVRFPDEPGCATAAR